MDAFLWALTGLSLFGTVLNAQKNIACFVIWGIANILWAVVDWMNGMHSRVLLDLVQLSLGIYGFMEWRK